MASQSLVIIRAATAAIACSVLTGCPSLERQYCERQIEECNGGYFGIRNVDDCTEQLEKNLDNLVSSKREDCENGIDDCLDRENCENFQQCMGATFLLDCL